MVKVPKPKKVSASFSIAQNAHAHSDACGRKEQEEQTKCRLRAKLAGRKKAAREEAANKADDDKENAPPQPALPGPLTPTAIASGTSTPSISGSQQREATPAPGEQLPLICMDIPNMGGHVSERDSSRPPHTS